MSVHHDDGGSAFPLFVPEGNGCGPVAYPGLSRRDWLAGLAMQGLISCDKRVTIEGRPDLDTIAKASYYIADGMIAEGKK